MPNLATVVLVNQLSELERMHELMSELRRHPRSIPETALSAVTLALDEVITNVIEHGYRDSSRHEIEVAVSLDDDWIECEVSDDGEPFDPTTALIDVSTGAEPNRVGGLGIHLVRQLIDELHYVRDHGRNRLRLRKRIVVQG